MWVPEEMLLKFLWKAMLLLLKCFYIKKVKSSKDLINIDLNQQKKTKKKF